MIANGIEAMEGLEKNKKLFITSFYQGEFINIKICDSGPGIYPDEREKIFSPFYTRKRTGSGIGLSICQRIILDHNGEIEVKDSSLGGAGFIIKIPLDKRTL